MSLWQRHNYCRFAKVFLYIIVNHIIPLLKLMQVVFNVSKGIESLQQTLIF